MELGSCKNTVENSYLSYRQKALLDLRMLLYLAAAADIVIQRMRMKYSDDRTAEHEEK